MIKAVTSDASEFRLGLSAGYIRRNRRNHEYENEGSTDQ